MNIKIIVLALLLITSLENIEARKKWIKCLGCIAACGYKVYKKQDATACTCLAKACHRI